MWGNLVTETAFLYNFTFGFPTKQSDMLLHLTHWQYWFWFWFTYYIVLYYFLFLRLIRYRVLKMSPKLTTSFRSHGKWGDLIVCFVPLSWCTNILSNSNFILRMIEWQSESSLFTLRVRGKQWYWVYKFELKTLSDINGTAINIGNNFWRNNTVSSKHHQLGLIQEKHNLTTNHLTWVSSGAKQFTQSNEFFTNSINSGTLNTLHLPTTKTSTVTSSLLQPTNNFLLTHNFSWVANQQNLTPQNISNVSINMTGLNQHVNVNSNNPNITRIEKIRTTQYLPVRLLKASTGDSLKLTYGNPSSFFQKPTSSNFYLVIKQKRYEPTSMSSNKYILNDFQKFSTNSFNPSNTLLYVQNNSFHSEVPSLQSNRRLLRTRRVLVIPAHTNITLITNSFDVMHSWYIPGLGVKMDCVPGRSTHHTLHIDHAGFYYGQCAEICGRYHHHMPIRVCALPFEHFLIWWYHYGAPFFLAGNQDRSSFKSIASKQLNW